MAQPIVDQVLKEMSELYPEAFIGLKFPGEKFRVISAKLDKELTIKTRRSDRVMILQSVRGKRVVHFEFQLRFNRKVPERIFVYNGALTAKYQMKVASYLFLIKPSRLVGDFGVYRSDLFEETVNEFRFPVIRLFDLQEAILSGEARYRIFAPLLLEMEKPSVARLRQIRDIINQEPGAKRRSEFFSFAAAIAQKHFDLKTIQSVFKEANMIDVNYWRSLPHFGDAMRANEAEAKKVAEKEGRQEGRQEGLQEMLIEMLSAHFGKVPSKTIRAIQSLHDPRKLKVLARKSLQTQSLAEVQKLLAANKTKTNGHNGKTRTAARRTA
jgi:hypothetical protein